MFKTKQKAYTLVEMMVVMGIMAMLTILGAGSMLGANDENVTEEAAQSILSGIRETQTKAISVTPDAGGHRDGLKAWALELNMDSGGTNNSYRLDSYYQNGLVLNNYQPATLNRLRSGVRVSISRMNGVNETRNYSTGQAFVTFTTPFARSYITFGSSLIPAYNFCIWAPSNRPEKDWEIDSRCPDAINSAWSQDYIVIHVRYKNKTRDIRVSGNGDAYIQ